MPARLATTAEAEAPRSPNPYTTSNVASLTEVATTEVMT